MTASESVEQPCMGDVLLLERFSGVDVPQLHLADPRVRLVMTITDSRSVGRDPVP